MNQQQAALIVRLNMTDADIAVMYPSISSRHYRVLREWGARGGDLQMVLRDGTHIVRNEPDFAGSVDYRLASRTVTFSGPGGTFELPEPMRVAPEKGTHYWVLELGAPPECILWFDDESDRCWLKQGRCHATEDNCMQWADALSKVMGVQS